MLLTILINTSRLRKTSNKVNNKCNCDVTVDYYCNKYIMHTEHAFVNTTYTNTNTQEIVFISNKTKKALKENDLSGV